MQLPWVQRLWRRVVAAGRRAQGINSPASEFVNDVFRGVPPKWTEETVPMLEAYRAELSEQISANSRSFGRWGIAVVVSVTFLATGGEVVSGWIYNVVRGGLLGATFGLVSMGNGAFHLWSRRRQADVCLANARWVLNRPGGSEQ